jgi:hypothetical protein
MTFPVFSAGEVLRAQDMNAVGMWKVASGTLSGTATNFAGCFTSDYRDYRIVLDSLVWNNTGYLYYQFLTGTTPASTGDYFWALSGFQANGLAYNNSNQTQTFGYLGSANVGANNLVIGSCVYDILGPQLAQRTMLTGQGAGVDTVYFHQSGMNSHNLTNAYTGIRFLTNSATTFTGNVTIYGYNR